MYNKIILFLTVWIAPATLPAQENLVPNPGFESINECPNQLSLISTPDEPFTYCNNWIAPNRGTSDIFHACCPWPKIVSVPDNFAGHVPAAKGNAYAGIHLFSHFNTASNKWLYREYLQVQLTEPLTAGKSYCVGFLTRPLRHNTYDSSNYIYAVQDFGIHISKEPVRDFSDWTSLHNLQVTPQIISEKVVNTTNWSRISGEYLAEGGEQWITIGNFEDDLNTFPVEIIETPVAPPLDPAWGNPHYAYYFVDEVFVIAVEEYWAFSQQYWKTCAGGNQLPLTARPGLDYYHWSTGDTTQQVIFTSGGFYTIDASYLGCPFRDTITVDAFDPPVINLGPDLDICINGIENSVILKNTTPLEQYLWSTNDTAPEISANQPGTYSLATEHICGHFEDTIELKGCNVAIFIPNVITPESADANSVFKPFGENIQFTSLEIFDYWGHLLYKTEQPEQGWDGTFKGKFVTPGVYMWRLRYYNEIDHTAIIRTGDVSVIR